MKVVYSEAHKGHDIMFWHTHKGVEDNLERAVRAEVILEALSNKYSLVEATREAEHELLLAQDPAVEMLYAKRDILRKTEYPKVILDDFVEVSGQTHPAVVGAASCALVGAQMLHDEGLVYALTRPPGHHASDNQIGGYCYFNNAALAAVTLAEQGNVAILDIDRHHGNGTQKIVLKEDGLFYFSINAAGTYPNITEGDSSCLMKRVKATNINLGPDITGFEYYVAINKMIDMIECVNPSALVISAGFDTSENEHKNLDAVPVFELDRHVFNEIGKVIGQAGYPTLVVQEGGYNVNSLGNDVAAFLEGLNGN